jgi:hypothetical protein
MGQRDLTMKWSIGAGKAKEPLISKGLIVDDGGMAFGWGVEQGHLGKTEIFCRYDRLNPEAVKAVQGWQKEQSTRAFNDRFFATGPVNEIGPSVSNYHLWLKKLQQALDPNGVSPEGGALV